MTQQVPGDNGFLCGGRAFDFKVGFVLPAACLVGPCPSPLRACDKDVLPPWNTARTGDFLGLAPAVLAVLPREGKLLFILHSARALKNGFQITDGIPLLVLKDQKQIHFLCYFPFVSFMIFISSAAGIIQ